MTFATETRPWWPNTLFSGDDPIATTARLSRQHLSIAGGVFDRKFLLGEINQPWSPTDGRVAIPSFDRMPRPEVLSCNTIVTAAPDRKWCPATGCHGTRLPWKQLLLEPPQYDRRTFYCCSFLRGVALLTQLLTRCQGTGKGVVNPVEGHSIRAWARGPTRVPPHHVGV